VSDIINIDMRKKAEEYKQVVEALDKIEYELLQLNILESKLRQQKLALEKKRKRLEDEAILSTKD
jgi:hypothetical protein